MSLSFSQRLGLRVGIEELTEGATGDEGLGETGGTVVLPDEPTETVEGALDEAQTAEAEVTDVTAEAEQMERTVETMEKIAAGLSVAMRNGGCTAGEAYAYQVALESAFGPFGMGPSASASLENIGSAKNPRLEATRVTLEGVQDTLSKWWAGLVAIWEKAYAAIKGWLMKVFDTIPAVKKRAAEIVAKANAAKGAPKKDKITFDAKSLCVGAGAVDAAGVAKATKDVVTFCDESLIKDKGIYGVTTALLLQTLRDEVDGKMAESAEATIVDKVLKLITDKSTTATKAASKDKYGGDGMTAKITDPYMGNKVMAVTTPSELMKDGKSIGVAKAIQLYSMKLVDGPDTANDAKEVSAAGADVCKAIGIDVGKLCDTLSAFRGLWQERDKSKSLLSSEVKKEIDKVAKDKDGGADKAARVKTCGSAIQSYASKNSNFAAQVSSYGLRCSQVALNYANKCLENIGEGTAKEEPKKEEPKEGETK